MRLPKALYLHEQLMLLALRDKRGTIAADGNILLHMLGAALLAELLLQKRISLEPGKRKLVNLDNPRRIGEPLLDECLLKLREARRRGSLKAWVRRFARLKKLNHRVARQLCRRRILRADEDTVLLFFSRKIYPQINAKPEAEIIETLRRVIFTDEDCTDPRTVVLLSLAEKANVLKNAFEKKDLRGRKARIKQVVAGECMGRVAKEVVDAMHAAVLVAVVIPSAVGGAR